MQDNKKNSSSNLVESPEKLAGPPFLFSEITVAIKPKAIRLKPVENCSSEFVFEHDALVQAASLSSDKETSKISRESSETCFLYRPIARVIPSSPLLKTLGSYEDRNSHSLQLNQINCSKSTMNLHQSIMPLSDTNKLHCTSISPYESEKTNARSHQKTNNGDPLDGYNWKKYGQKQVKGSTFPRGYYRCAQPDCLVKKMIERFDDGKISEIVYRGDHNHSKPQKIKHISSSRLSEQASFTDGRCRNSMDDILVIDSLLDPNFNDEGFIDASIARKALHWNDSHLVIPADFGSFGENCNGEEDAAFAGMDGYEKKSQKRNNGNKTRESNLVSQKASIPKVMASIDYNHVTNDGYHWRKYGQKFVKGNSYPRNYYRCTYQNCSARKYVERASDGPDSFITTYEGYHKHE